MNKSSVPKNIAVGTQEHVKQEKQLMAECECVFLVRLMGGFQDSAYLYMVLEAAMGGEFFLYMQARMTALCQLEYR